VTRAPDAIVTGSYDTEAAFDIGWSFGVVSFLAWVGTTLFVLAAGLLFAAVARKQLLDAGQLMTRDAGGLVIATILMVVGLPTLAVAAIVTLVGIPIGIGLLLIVLPILLFLGYLTAGIELGSLLIRRVVPVTESSHTYLSALAGLLTLQLVALVPFAGFWVLLFIATVGAGLLMLYIWRGWRGTRSTATPAASPGQAIPA
jgi:hypothetical protein